MNSLIAWIKYFISGFLVGMSINGAFYNPSDKWTITLFFGFLTVSFTWLIRCLAAVLRRDPPHRQI